MRSKRISSYILRRIMECQVGLSDKRFALFRIVSVSDCCLREDKLQLWVHFPVSVNVNWKTKNSANTKKSSQPFMNVSKTRIKIDWDILFSSQVFDYWD